ncbi:methyl-accepting chemotaxis protein [Thiobacillus sp.]|uniref:methyl-accepting chemotaxis protein n=2 Tax=Thiobacillus sp. TaxID=924 RepID=UPI0025E93972|nr:methyl-accepting chemotaxis protein [Thiobacillus sp.]MBT9540514.1 Tar ligand binding domain-containing protein [Thiobacillus sp.]
MLDKLENLSIKTILIVAITSMTLLLVIVGVTGIRGTAKTLQMDQQAVQASTNEAGVMRVLKVMETSRAQVLLALQHNPSYEFASMHDHALSLHLNALGQSQDDLKKLWSEFYAEMADTPEQKLADAFYADSANLAADGFAKAKQALESGNWSAAQSSLLNEIDPAFNKSAAAQTALLVGLLDRSKAHSEEASEIAADAKFNMILTIIIASLAALAIGGLLMRMITKPLTLAVDLANKVAEGDLSFHLDDVARDNEFGRLLVAQQLMERKLADIVGQVRTGTDTITVAAREIATGNADLSSRTEQQASSLEETASSMEELTSTVKQNAENARQANQLVQSTAEVAVKGGNVVGQVVDTMASISESSRKIADIIGVIDGIAFQTNILALNAAVEAARAGEQGRGFAVVASEVRNLAQRSAGAAKEIKSLIEDSVGQVESGGKLVGEAGKTMGEIVTSVKRVTDIMGEIAAASQEQSAGIEQVNQAITQMDDVTQQNAALVEQAAAAAMSLQEQADVLAQAVSVFKLDSHNFTQHAPRKTASSRNLPKPHAMEARSRPATSQKKLATSSSSDGEWEEF